ncbi:MAG: rhomboid family intramembrane serine protease [Chthoniobacterales bacterium]
MRLSGRRPTSFTRRWTERRRVVLLWLIGANVAAFVTQLFLEAYQPGFARDYLGLSDNGLRSAHAWQVCTAIFLHRGAWHLVGNMLVLYLLGRDVESIVGRRHFLLLYLAGAVSGEVGHLIFMPSTTVLFGASGGVAAVLMAYATILPELELTSMVFFVFPIRLKAKHLVCAACAIVATLIIIDRFGTVTHSAWLGGCAAGWLYSHLLGFGRPSFVQRTLRQRRAAAEHARLMTFDQFVTEEIDPLLDKISREGMQSLTRQERRTLAQVREKISEPAQSH